MESVNCVQEKAEVGESCRKQVLMCVYRVLLGEDFVEKKTELVEV